MANWRDTILGCFQPQVCRLTLVADPDGLLTEEGMLSAIRGRGFDLLPFDDPVAFRYAYESQYRSRWDAGQDTDLVVVLRSTGQRLTSLPHDLLRSGRPLTFALHQLFPKLNYPVIAGLDRSYLDALDEAYRDHDGGELTERETKDFVLMHCFGVVPKLVKKPVDLLRLLLSLHSRRVRIPDALAAHLLESLPPESSPATWPVAEMFAGREGFLRFLQDEWPLFLASQDGSSPPGRVPFGHDEVRVFIDTLFLDGSLKPVEWHGRA